MRERCANRRAAMFSDEIRFDVRFYDGGEWVRAIRGEIRGQRPMHHFAVEGALRSRSLRYHVIRFVGTILRGSRVTRGKVETVI